MKKLLNKSLLYPLVLILLSSFISFQNYTPGTFLSGWDTLHPEFNFPLNIERTINGVFRPEQGLGAVAGHSHMADLPRILFLFISSFVLPISFLRYFYVFLMLIIGPLGMYFLLEKQVIKNKNISFLASLFYLLNIGTVQIFIVPFEMFVTQYAFLPLIFLFAINYLKEGSKKSLLFFSIATLLSTPIAYAATLWYIQFGFLLLFLLTFSKLNQISFKRALKIILLTLAINSFWILPNIYFVLNYGASVMEANINKIFSPQAFLYNKEFGDLKSILLLRNFLFDWNVYIGNGNFGQLLSTWNTHLIKLVFLGFIFGILSLWGTISSVINRNKIIASFIPGLFLCLFLLINDNFPTGFIYTFLQNHVSIFKEALRFPGDKALGLFVFSFALFFAFSIQNIGKFLSKFSPRLTIITALILTASLFYFSAPMFTGNLISPFMRVKIPQEYFSLFNYLNKQEDSGRIANLPIQSFWGWDYYDWSGAELNSASSPASEADRRGKETEPSFQGAGFLWFGIKQPILVRDFDRWNSGNEQYYREMSYAIYSQDSALLQNVINKYDIHYILLDENIIAPQSNSHVLFYRETENQLGNLVNQKFLSSPVKFGKIFIYKVISQQKNEKFSQLNTNIPNIYEDLNYKQYGNYIAQNNLSLTDNTSILKNNLIDIRNDGIKLKISGISNNTSSFISTEKNIDAQIFAQIDSSNKLVIKFYPDSFIENKKSAPIVAQINLGNKKITNTTLSVNQKDNFSLSSVNYSEKYIGRVLLSTQTANSISLYDDSQAVAIKPDFSTLNYSLLPCAGSENINTFGIDLEKSKDGFTLFATDTNICLIIPASSLLSSKPLDNSSLLGINFSYKGSKKPDVCAVNLLTGGCIKNIDTSSKIGNKDISKLGFQIKLNATEHINNTATLFGMIIKKTTQQKVSYKNIKFDISQPFYSAQLDSKALQSSLNLSLKTQGNSLFIPFIKTDELSKDVTLITQPNNTCPTVGIQELNKKIASDHIEYSSKNGTYCDFFSYQNLPQDTSYAVVVTSKNVSGLPLNLCISNPYTNHCDIYATLPAKNEKTQSAFILPPSSFDKTGFTIDVNNFAINKTPSINYLYSIEITPFPYYWITSSKDVSAITDKNIIVYPYSFDPGFKAYEVRSINFFTTNFPFVFGKEIKNHVKINGWENGFILDTPTINKIVVYFIPQYLEYAGFAILLAVFASLIFLTFQPPKE